MEYDYSPAVLEKLVYAGAQSSSFEQASRNLEKLAELAISDQRVRRVTIRIGEERVAQRDEQTAAYEKLSLPKQRESPAGQSPSVACVEMDGGRMQIRDRDEKAAAASEHGFWREMKIGCLTAMTSQRHEHDPCPHVPQVFVDPQEMAKIAREIKGVSSAAAVENEPPADAEQQPGKRPGRPEPLARSVVATRGGVEEFGPLIAAAAWQRGFAAAGRKAFVADGSEANWGVWRRWFSDYVPILDFVHALCYVYAAAMAGRTWEEGWPIYCQWAQWVWSGEVEQVIAALVQRQQEVGAPAADEPESSPRQQIATALGYLHNQGSRMRYAEYRQAGLPITSSGVESTIKRINRRVKGSEKFWSVGAEALLTLAADYLSDTPTLTHFWRDRPHRLTGQRHYNQAA